jgi:uncharacterized protein
LLLRILRLGLKDVITDGDLPVVWTNTRYGILYMNMDMATEFSPATCRIVFSDALLWIGTTKSSASK